MNEETLRENMRDNRSIVELGKNKEKVERKRYEKEMLFLIK